MRQTLSKVVTELKQNPAFTNVDTLPADQRRSLVGTNVIIPGQHFSLSIEMAENTFQGPLPPSVPQPLSPVNHNVKTSPRVSRPISERNGATVPATEN